MVISRKLIIDMNLSNFSLNKDCQKVLNILNQDNETSRIVGGYVRSYLKKNETKDIDIATKLTPDEAISKLSKAGVKTVPTGLSHGTISAFINDQTFEITTLRKDTNHDGRHADVVFTKDWLEDASRRDFTINAIYMNSDGNIYDPFDGISDLNNNIIKFIGDPEKRIKEDYLRVLRYYRFLSFYDSSADSKTRKLIQKNANNIVTLSPERIHEEFFKILVNDKSGKVINLMNEDGILDLIFSHSIDLKTYNRMISIDNELFFVSDNLLNFVTLMPKSIENIEDLKFFNFSNKEKRIINFLINPENEIKSYQSVKEVRAMLYKFGIDRFSRLTRLYWARDKKISNISQWRALLAMGQSWNAPKFPVKARDILLLGVPEGPLVGEILREVEKWWIDSDFIEDKASLFERIKAIVSSKI
tara:strand:+ start:3096 stop:4346 length:1251 start_codon:yes stop_codon:yes gene_type:complete